MKNLLRNIFRLDGRPKPVPLAPAINLAAFGKHPGWDDHIPGIGLETEQLARLKQSFYVAGIGRQIDSGAWEKLDAVNGLKALTTPSSGCGKVTICWDGAGPPPIVRAAPNIP